MYEKYKRWTKISIKKKLSGRRQGMLIFKTLFLKNKHIIISVQFSSVAQACLTFCDPMDFSMPDIPVHHQLLGFTQTHVH